MAEKRSHKSECLYGNESVFGKSESAGETRKKRVGSPENW